MTPKKLLEIRQSEIRQRLAQLAETDATPETETEIAGLSKEYQAAEVRMQAMIIADDVPGESGNQGQQGRTVCTGQRGRFDVCPGEWPERGGRRNVRTAKRVRAGQQ